MTPPSPSPDETTPAPLSELRPETLDRNVEIRLLSTLIVEPDPEARALLYSVAGGRGHEVVCVEDCAAALEEVQRVPSDILLLRLNHATAPAVAEFLHQISATHSAQDVCLIALTDDDEPASRIEAWLKRGFQDFITCTPQHSASVLRNRLAIAEHALLRRRAWRREEMVDLNVARRFEELFVRAPEATLIVTARDGYILEANPAAESILGIPRTELVQRYLSLVLPDLFDHEDYDPEMLMVNDAIRMLEVCIRRPDGARRWLDVYLAKIQWPQTHALLLRLQDVSSVKDRESRRLLEARQEAASRVMLGVAREMSDALTTIRGNLELLARLPSARAESRELIHSATLGCEDAEELSRKIASLGRRQQGLDVRKRPFQLKPMLEKAVPFALLGGSSRPMIQVDEDLWPVEGDEMVLGEALKHLVDNADRSMPEGGTIFVEARNVREARAQTPDLAGVCIRVRDEGPGISATDLPHIFDPFFSTQGRDGMGLAFAAAAVRGHGGSITVESTPGEGTTVQLWLPVNLTMLLKDPELLEPTTAPGATFFREPPNNTTGIRSRVLFMDDELQIRILVQKILTTHGFDVYCTKDGAEAINVFRKAHEFGTPFDVLLMDLDVRSGMGGMEAVAQLRTEHPNLKALLTTGYLDDALLDSHREHGFLGVIPKPFQVERLVGAVRSLAGVGVKSAEKQG